MDCGDMSPLSPNATCRVVPKRSRACHSKILAPDAFKPWWSPASRWSRWFRPVLIFLPADGFAHQFVDVGQVELFLDAGGIALDGFEADMQVLGNLPRAVAGAQQLKDLQFPVA